MGSPQPDQPLARPATGARQGDHNPPDRRAFLKLSLCLAAGAGLAACGQNPTQPPAPEPSPSPAALPLPSPTPLPPGKVILTGGDADSWAWEQPLRGKLIDLPDCQSLTVQVNDQEFPALQNGEEFVAKISLEPGDNPVRAVCQRPDGQEVISAMLHYQQRLRHAPRANIEIALQNDTLVLDAKTSQDANGEPGATLERTWSARPGNPAGLTLAETGQPFEALSSETLALAVPGVDGEYYVTLTVKDSSGAEDSSSIYFEVAAGQARIPDYDRENPAWVENAIVYGIIPRNFGDPAFQAVTDRLPYLAELGINAIWLAPVNVSPPADYGYAIVDYFELNPRYGTKDDFRHLVQEAHRLKLRVLMDFVPNHSSAKHPYYLDAQERQQDSHYYDFYDRDEQGVATHYFDWTHLPNLNFHNPEVQRWITEAFCYWVREFDVDGFRVDAAWGIRQRQPDYWPAWRRALKRIKPDLLLLAEASARDPYYFDNGFDAAYDWTDQLGRWAWEMVWDSYKNRLLSYNLEAALSNRPDGYHPDALIFRFLNNNDTKERFITRHGEGMTRVSTALLLTLPGIPCIYTADEVGEWFSPYYDPQPLTWQERYPGLRQYHQKLIALRTQNPSLRSRSWTVLSFKPIPQEVFGYIRHSAASSEPLLVLLNFFADAAEMEFELPESWMQLARVQHWRDLLNDEEVATPAGALKTFTLQGLSARILTPKIN